MEKKQTAVQWLREQLTYNNGLGVLHPSHSEFADLSQIFEQAIAMEREQIEEAYMDGLTDISTYDSNNIFNYYKQTFKSEK